MNEAAAKSAILLIHCTDQKGIVISVTEFIFRNGGNILYLNQHVDAARGVFFMRIEWDLQDFVIVRDVIPLQSVKARMLDSDYAYARITNFQAKTTRDLDDALKELADKNRISQVKIHDVVRRDRQPVGDTPVERGQHALFAGHRHCVFSQTS